MEISQYGKDSILIKGRKEAVWFSPRKEDVNAKTSDARIVIFRDAKENFIGLDAGNKVVIWGPGEYEIAGIEISGTRMGEEGVSYIVQIDGLKVGWLSTVRAEITDKKKEKLAECDVLIVPNEGDIKEVWQKTKTLGESYLIVTGLTSDDRKQLLDLADREDLVPMDALKVEKENLPEVTEVVLLATK